MPQYPSTFDEIIGLATAGMKFKTWPHTLELLPVQGLTNNPAQTISDAQRRLRNTLALVNGMRKGPYGLPQAVVQHLENIRFHVTNGLFLIDVAQRTGHSLREPVANVDGLQAAIENHAAAVGRARPAWDGWLSDAHATKGENDLLPPLPVASSTFSYFGADAALPDLTGGLVKSPSLNDYLAIGLVAGGLLLLFSAVK